MTISFKDRVAIVTGAGGGLGRAYALELAKRGAKVVVNDLGGSRDGTGHSDAALKVVEEIEAAGGEAMSDGGSVTEYDHMVELVAKTKAKWGGIHVLINNAGVLRDKSFAKMEPADFKFVVDVHLIGSANVTKAVWETMREQNYGRVLMTASSTGLYGNFGQANYGAAKLGLAGLTKTLYLEGAKNNIKVNTIAPTAGTRMTEDLFPPEAFQAFAPEKVVPAALYLVSEDAPTNMIVGAGAGVFQAAYVTLTQGKLLTGDDLSPEGIAAHWSEIVDRTGEMTPQSGARAGHVDPEKAAGRLNRIGVLQWQYTNGILPVTNRRNAMYSESDLDDAVAAGAISREAAAALRSHVARSHSAPAVDEEHFKLLSGFNDIFVAIAVGLVLVALAWIGESIFTPLAGALVAIAAWGLAEYFTRQRRMALPSILLLIAFVGGVAATLVGMMVEIDPDFSDRTNAVIGAGIGLVAAGAAWVHWKRFMVPITVAAGAAALVAVAVALTLAAIPAAKDAIYPILLAGGARGVRAGDVVGHVGPGAPHPPLGCRLLAAPRRRAADRASGVPHARRVQREHHARHRGDRARAVSRLRLRGAGGRPARAARLEPRLCALRDVLAVPHGGRGRAGLGLHRAGDRFGAADALRPSGTRCAGWWSARWAA